MEHENVITVVTVDELRSLPDRFDQAHRAGTTADTEAI